MNRIVAGDDDDDDDGFPIIANNAEAPCNQPFKLKKPAMQGDASGALKVQVCDVMWHTGTPFHSIPFRALCHITPVLGTCHVALLLAY